MSSNRRNQAIEEILKSLNKTEEINEMINFINNLKLDEKSIEKLTKGDVARFKRQIDINDLSHALNDDDENENVGIEEGRNRDGEADHHAVVDEHTENDRSNSEYWSSFSSSEEALLKCAGLILSLPLKPNRSCNESRNFNESSFPNGITYT